VGRQSLTRARIGDAYVVLDLLWLLLTTVQAAVRPRQDLVLENLLLRHERATVAILGDDQGESGNGTVPTAVHIRSGLHRTTGETTTPIERSHVPTRDRLRSSRGLKTLRTGQRFPGRLRMAARAARRVHPVGRPHRPSENGCSSGSNLPSARNASLDRSAPSATTSVREFVRHLLTTSAYRPC
jgi:hypothetical protein